MTSTWFVLPLAVALDAVLGDPVHRFHPVRRIGALAAAIERATYRPSARRVSGFGAWLLVVATTIAVAAVTRVAAHRCHLYAGIVVDILLIYFAIAPRDLAHHALRVEAALTAADLVGARSAVGNIVGRDTDPLDGAAVCRAAVESVAESTVDGVTAPLLWAALLGPLGAVLYRVTNTLDSMWGHHDERYEEFGFVAARADDIANYLPARLTVLWVALAALPLGLSLRGAWRVAWKHGPRHASPNSGLSEAAFAGALGVTLGGPNRYAGQWCDGPHFGETAVSPEPHTVRRCVQLMWVTALLAVLTLSLCAWLAR